MNIRREAREACELLTVEGDIDLSTSPSLRKHLEGILDRERTSLVIDLSSVRHMDSSGIAVLIEAERWARKHGRRLLLASLSDQVRMVLELARLQGFFSIAEDLEGALRLCRAG